MTEIFKYIKDPAWWFSAFFIAIIASVIAGFAKDYIQVGFGKLSAKARQRQAKRLADRERVLIALEENEAFLILSMIRAVALLILMATTFILFAVSPMFSKLTATWCQVMPGDPTCSLSGSFRSLFPLVIFGSLSVLTSFRAMTTARISMQGFRRYRQKRRLPALE